MAEQEVDNNLSALQNQAPPPSIRRIIPTNSNFNEKILFLEPQVRAKQREPESDDMMFFKSVLPFVRNIPSNRKLRFRSKILELVEEFSCDTSATT